MSKKLLTRTVSSINGRNGYITSKDRHFRLDLGLPIEMGGVVNSLTNPEELLAAGYSSCFASSMEYMLRQAGATYTSIYATAAVSLVMDEAKSGFKFEITIDASVDGVSEEVKVDVINKAYAFCPYSKAFRGNINIILNII